MSSLSLPMRNWNTWIPFISHLLIFVWAYLWGIEMDDKFCKSQLRFWFEPTYEELKYSFRTYFKFWNWCLSLPMRNWNIEQFFFLKFFYLCLSLPMRNWNTLSKLALFAIFFGLSLPMRNWNKNRYVLSFHSEFGLSLPMRNWNNLADVTAAIISEVWAYLWGIEIKPILLC